MTPRQQRRLKTHLADQMRLERNGAPIPGEIAQFMTKPKAPERLFQCWVAKRAGGEIPFLPATTNEGAIGALVETINAFITMGRERDFTKAWVVELVPEPFN
jgi:hypothetical protein